MAVLRLRTDFFSNALKYTEAGRITIKLEQVPGQGLSLAIADTGCGIHPEDLPPHL